MVPSGTMDAPSERLTIRSRPESSRYASHPLRGPAEIGTDDGSSATPDALVVVVRRPTDGTESSNRMSATASATTSTVTTAAARARGRAVGSLDGSGPPIRGASATGASHSGHRAAHSETTAPQPGHWTTAHDPRNGRRPPLTSPCVDHPGDERGYIAPQACRTRAGTQPGDRSSSYDRVDELR